MSGIAYAFFLFLELYSITARLTWKLDLPTLLCFWYLGIPIFPEPPFFSAICPLREWGHSEASVTARARCVRFPTENGEMRAWFGCGSNSGTPRAYTRSKVFMLWSTPFSRGRKTTLTMGYRCRLFVHSEITRCRLLWLWMPVEQNQSQQFVFQSAWVELQSRNPCPTAPRRNWKSDFFHIIVIKSSLWKVKLHLHSILRFNFKPPLRFLWNLKNPRC